MAIQSSKPRSRDAVIARLEEFANPEHAKVLQRFFKTGPGEYGEGDQFLGIRVPVLREVSKEFQSLAADEIDALVQSPWHEARLLACLIWVRQYQRATTEKLKSAVIAHYLRRRSFVNNWDLVDSSAPYLLGPHLLKRDRGILDRLARSRNLWDRRIAVLATFHFIRHGEFAPTLSLTRTLINDKHDLMHKALGWMLREIGKRDEKMLRVFLEECGARMPRTMLRYAIERFPEADRRRFLALKETRTR